MPTTSAGTGYSDSLATSFTKDTLVKSVMYWWKLWATCLLIDLTICLTYRLVLLGTACFLCNDHSYRTGQCYVASFTLVCNTKTFGYSVVLASIAQYTSKGSLIDASLCAVDDSLSSYRSNTILVGDITVMPNLLQCLRIQRLLPRARVLSGNWSLSRSCTWSPMFV